MASNAFAGVGTVFQRWSGQDWETIAEIRAVTGPSASRDVIDVTSLDTEEGSKEFITGFRQGGEVTLAMNFTRGTYELMKEDFEAQDEKDYAIAFDDVDNSYLQFYGLVSKLPVAVESDDKVTANITITITGLLEFGTGEVSEGVSYEVPSEDEPIPPSSEDLALYLVLADNGDQVIDDDGNRVVHYM